MPVGEAQRRISGLEFVEWVALDNLRAEEQEAKEAARQTRER
jgi:hypothetical protein